MCKDEKVIGTSSPDIPSWVGRVSYDEIEVGTELGPREWTITPEEIDRHCLSTGEFHEWYTVGLPSGGRAAPVSISYMPPRYIFSEKVPLSGLFAAWNHQQFQLLRPGVKLILDGRVSDKYVRRDREWVWYEVSCKEADAGIEVFRTSRGHVLDYTTDLQNDAANPSSAPAGERVGGYDPVVFESQNTGDRVADAPVRAFQASAGNYPIGSELMPASFQLTQRSVTEFLHGHRGHDEAEGLPAPVASGPHAAAQIHKMMMAGFGQGYLEKGTFNLKFVRLMLREDFLTAKGVVVAHRLEDGADRVECNVWVERQTGEKVVVGSASALIAL